MELSTEQPRRSAESEERDIKRRGELGTFKPTEDAKQSEEVDRSWVQFGITPRTRTIGTDHDHLRVEDGKHEQINEKGGNQKGCGQRKMNK